MKHRIVSGLVLVPLMIVLSTTPAYAIFGSIIAAIQRAQMIVNQGVQIYNDAMEKITMNGQLTELTDQFSHLKEQALGTVGALTQPFTDLSSIPNLSAWAFPGRMTLLNLSAWAFPGRMTLPAWPGSWPERWSS